MSSVDYVKIPKNTIDLLKQGFFQSLNLIEYSFQKEIKQVVIKPNMCYHWDHFTGQTTDPRFIGALIDVIHNQTSPKVGNLQYAIFPLQVVRNS